MKVTLPKDYRKLFTLEQLDMARKIIKDMKDDEIKPDEYAEMAINHWSNRNDECNWCEKVYSASAEICKNGYELHPYGEGYDNLDIWLTFVAETRKGFVKGGAYMSDIWQIGLPDKPRWSRFWIKEATYK